MKEDTSITPDPQRAPIIAYPDSDGQPMADTTLQFDWISRLKWGLEALFRDDPQVFVAGDLLWYPIEGDNVTRRAPDTMVVFGRPKGYRGSYQQWKEAGIAPQVVFEVLSPGNTAQEMRTKWAFYQRHGVEEYYLYDPHRNWLAGWLRQGNRLVRIAQMHGWVSPRLGTRFALTPETLTVYRPDGDPLADYLEVVDRAELAEARAERAETTAQAAQARAERLAAQLRALGIDPDV